MMLYFKALFNVKDFNKLVGLFPIAGAAFLAGLIATKTIEGDLESYELFFYLVPQQSFYDNFFRLSFGRDFGYQIINFFGYYASFGFYRLFLFGMSFISYLLLLRSALLLLEAVRVNNKSFIVLSMTLVTFYPPYFEISSHLFRQHIAVCLAIYSIALLVSKNKHWWVVFVLAVTVHSSVIIFSFFAIIAYFLQYLAGSEKINDHHINGSRNSYKIMFVAFILILSISYVASEFFVRVIILVKDLNAYDLGLDQGRLDSMSSNRIYLLQYALCVIFSGLAIVQWDKSSLSWLALFLLTISTTYFVLEVTIAEEYKYLFFRLSQQFAYLITILPAVAYLGIRRLSVGDIAIMSTSLLTSFSAIMVVFFPILFFWSLEESRFDFVEPIYAITSPFLGIL